MKTKTATFASLFVHRRGIAIFMATLILLSISILAMSSMARLSEATQTTGKALENKKLSLLANAATRIVLAEVTEKVINGDTPPFYINFSNTLSGQSQFKVLYDNRLSPQEPLFGYRASANLLLTGDGSTMPPGTDIPISSRDSCYDIVVDTREVIPMTGTVKATDNTAVSAGLPTGYYWGQIKSVGVTSCFRKRN